MEKGRKKRTVEGRKKGTEKGKKERDGGEKEERDGGGKEEMDGGEKWCKEKQVEHVGRRKQGKRLTCIHEERYDVKRNERKK